MAIDPNNISTKRVGELPNEAFNLTDLIPHEVGTDLKSGTLQSLADVIGAYLSVSGGVGFRAVSVSDGETLPATTTEEFILVGIGTFQNVGGGSAITTTEELNALISNGVTWSIGVEIPISAELTGLTQFIRSGFTTTFPSEDAVFNALALKADLSSPNLTGIPTAPTASVGSNTTQIATTAFVMANSGGVTTTAGIVNRVWFTADPTTITAGTFYLTSATGKGTAASAIQSVVNNDNEKKYFTQDLIGLPFANATLFPPGTYAGNLSSSTTPNSAQQRFTVELYKCNNAGTPIASGVTGAPVGSLGVTVIVVLDSGLLTLADGSVTNVPVSGNLASQLSIAIGERIRYHVSAEKVGTTGANITQSVYYGTNYNCYLDVPVTFNTSSITNVSTVSGFTATDALNTLFNITGSLESNNTDKTVWNNGKGNIPSNTSFGDLSLKSNSSGSGNSGFGYSSMSSLTTGIGNSGFGNVSLLSLTTGSANTAIGENALASITTNTNNSALGNLSLTYLTSGIDNTAVGSASGTYYGSYNNLNTSNRGVFLGNSSRPLANNSANEIVIGYDAVGSGSNTATIGNSLIADTYLKGIIHLNGVLRLKNYTVSTLPIGTEGDTAYVTDALTPSYRSTVVGGGSEKCPVFFNGTNWLCQ